MRYVHGLRCLGGVRTPDGRNVLLFYKQPSHSDSCDLHDPIEKVEESAFALLLPSEVERGEFEQKINSVQMDLDETYLTQTILGLSDLEFVVLLNNAGA